MVNDKVSEETKELLEDVINEELALEFIEEHGEKDFAEYYEQYETLVEEYGQWLVDEYVGIGANKPYKRIEHEIYTKIISNKDGDCLKVVRGKKAQDKECTLYRFGYPKIQYGLDPANEDPLGFDGQFYDFMISQVGLWLLDYVSRHDARIYHNLLYGIKIPKGGFDLSDEEREFINHSKLANFPKNG